MHITATRVGIILILLAMLIGPWFSPPGFDWVKHTTSQQAGQFTAGAYWMRFGFVAFGIGLTIDVFDSLRRKQWPNVLFLVFGVSMILVAVFSHRPLDPALAYDLTDDWLHSFFATLMGFAFGFGVGWRMVFMRDVLDLALSAIAALASITLPLLMWQMPELAGAWQRLMFVICFVWFWRFVPQPSR